MDFLTDLPKILICEFSKTKGLLFQNLWVDFKREIQISRQSWVPELVYNIYIYLRLIATGDLGMNR